MNKIFTWLGFEKLVTIMVFHGYNHEEVALNTLAKEIVLLVWKT
jgi:hypothetical protein